MREISPAISHTCDEWLSLQPKPIQDLIAVIRKSKKDGARLRPSQNLIDKSGLLNSELRIALIDQIATLVDENLCGRSDMCQQYAYLMSYSLSHLGIENYAVLGTAMYFRDGVEVFRWNHAWVRAGTEIIDCNTDILHENPFIPEGLQIPPYWGGVTQIPKDRRLREAERNAKIFDPDIDGVWWPDLRNWIDNQGLKKA